MAKALGIGGVFFKTQDPKALGDWYQTHLGLELDPSSGGTHFEPDKMPPGAYSVWAPFKNDTSYFEPSNQDYMMNLVVDDRDACLDQVRSGGAKIVGTPDDHPFGRFGWFIDPEGNKVELWQPKVTSS